jgi:hypothetical protein
LGVGVFWRGAEYAAIGVAPRTRGMEWLR